MNAEEVHKINDGIMAGRAPVKQWKFFRRIMRDKYLYLLLLPIVIYYIIFKYYPMFGDIIAFKDYRFSKGILGSEWVGLKHFRNVFNNSLFYMVLKNTLLLNAYSLVFGFPAPIVLALLLNEVRNLRFKKVVQNILYLPHFISWVILGGLIIALLSPSTGVLNLVLKNVFGIEPIYFMSSTFWWPIVFVASGIWQGTGWGTIIYLAAISGIDGELYEASRMDGANKLRQMWHITLPGIRSTIAILLILRMGSILNIGFEHIFVLQNSAVYDVADVISTYVYRVGLQGMQYSATTAVGLFQSATSLVLMLGVTD